MSRAWMTGEVRLLHKMREQRFTVRQIARTLNRTENAVIERLRYVPATRDKPAHKKPIDRLPPLPKVKQTKTRTDYWLEHEIETMRTLAAQGCSAWDVCDATGRSYSGVRGKASALGIRFRGWGRARPPRSRIEQEGKRLNRNAAEGSARLLEKLLELAA